MTVLSRRISKVQVGGLDCLGAVQTNDTAFVACPIGTTVDAARKAFGNDLQSLCKIGQGLMATLSGRAIGDAAEPALLQGKNVVVAFRNGETAASAVDWLSYHAKTQGADAALIFDRDPPANTHFAATLADLAPSLPVIVASADCPFGQPNKPDCRNPALAPAAQQSVPRDADPWHSPLGAMAIFELLRHRFLSQARAVAFLDIADLLLPGDDVSIFDRAVAASGQIVPMVGLETYPWRLRQNQPAPHSDHIAHRRAERRRLISWAAAPSIMPPDVPWKPGRPDGVPIVEDPPAQYRRAMGVTFPGAPIKTLVRKSELVEDASLLSHMEQAFGAKPIRLPTAQAIPPRPKSNSITVVTAMKNEGPFILDWIAHNRVLGVNHFLVYTNDCEDGTDQLLDALKDAGVTRRDNPFRQTGKVPQHAAFRAAQSEAVVTQADWLLTLDVDEYINIHVGAGRLPDLLETVPEAHVISMPWRLFGNADVRDFADVPVTRQFTYCAPAFAPRPLQAWAFKSLFRNADMFRRLGVHRPKGIESAVQGHLRWVNGSGHALPSAVWRGAWRMSKANWGYDLVSVNHYAVRSAESFLVKRDRGRVNHTTRDQGAAYWFRMNHNAEQDLSIQRYNDAVASEKASLLALPGVEQLHEKSVQWHKSRIAVLKETPENAALFAEITSDRMQRLSRIATCFGSNVFMAGPHVIPDHIVARDPSKPFFFTVDPADADAP